MSIFDAMKTPALFLFSNMQIKDYIVCIINILKVMICKQAESLSVNENGKEI